MVDAEKSMLGRRSPSIVINPKIEQQRIVIRKRAANRVKIDSGKRAGRVFIGCEIKPFGCSAFGVWGRWDRGRKSHARIVVPEDRLKVLRAGKSAGNDAVAVGKGGIRDNA